MRFHRLMAAPSAAGLLLFASANLRAAGDWRPVLTRAFESLDPSRSETIGAPTLDALKPLWEQAPTLGAEWAMLQTQPIILEMEVRDHLTPAKFEAMTPLEQKALLENVAAKTSLEARGRVNHFLSQFDPAAVKAGDNGQSLERLLKWKKRLLVFERWRLYLEPSQIERLDAASMRVNAELWENRGEAMKELARLTDKAAFSRSGSDTQTDLMERSLAGFLQSRSAWPNSIERNFASELKPYSPGLDPNRFFLLEPGDPSTRAVLYFNPWNLAARHAVSMGPELPSETVLLMKGPERRQATETALRAHNTLHEGFHATEPPGTRERLLRHLSKFMNWEAASALTHILIEGFAEMRARRAFASLLADGRRGKTPVLEAIYTDFENRSPRPSPDTSYEQWVEHWLGSWHVYSPFVEIIKSLERSLGGIWAVEDLIHHGELGALEEILEAHRDVFDKMSQQLLFFVRNGTKDTRGRQDDFEVKKVFFKVIDEIFSGRSYPAEEIEVLVDIGQRYFVWAHKARSALLFRKEAFTTMVKAPTFSADADLGELREAIERAARENSWVPFWVPHWIWRPAFLLFSRFGIPLL